MIQYVKGDLFRSPAQTLVNTVNTVGVMGKGIALTFKKLYPDMFSLYQKMCEEKRFKIGSLFVWRTPAKLIVNFPTKNDWRRPSQPRYIEAGLETFVAKWHELGIRSVAFPPLGCGNGELDFLTQVQPLMEKHLAALPIPVFIYAPLPRTEMPEHRNIDEVRSWLRREPRALPFAEFWTDLRDLLQHKDRFETLARGTPFEATFIEDDEPRIRVRAADKTYTFNEEEVQELWRELRDHMVVTTSSFPMRARELSYLLPVLAELKYVDAISLGDSYDQLTYAPRYGLRLTPYTSQQNQRELALT